MWNSKKKSCKKILCKIVITNFIILRYKKNVKKNRMPKFDNSNKSAYYYAFSIFKVEKKHILKFDNSRILYITIITLFIYFFNYKNVY